jgi:hypothetical protein
MGEQASHFMGLDSAGLTFSKSANLAFETKGKRSI